MRQPIDLDPTKAVSAIIRQALETDVVRLALASYLEGAGLQGEWRLSIKGAQLIPVDAAQHGEVPKPPQSTPRRAR